jgi:hypothetical protein
MSCSARLPVYLLMIAALVPGDRVPLLTKVGVMLLMYALGTFGAFGFAWLFKRTLLKGAPPLMIMELPPYRMPGLKDVALQMVERAGIFLRRAGTVILGISIVLWFLSAYPKSPDAASPSEQLAHSFAGRAGHVLEPVIKPLGFDWQIGIGLISSFAAREVFVQCTVGRRRGHRAFAYRDVESDVAGWAASLHAIGVLHLDDLLRVRDAVHEYHRDRETRDEQLAVAPVPNCVHDWHRVDFIIGCLPGRSRIWLLMNPQVQSLLALLIVAVAAIWLVRRSLAKRKNPGCGGDCGCPSTELKAQLKRDQRTAL